MLDTKACEGVTSIGSAEGGEGRVHASYGVRVWNFNKGRELFCGGMLNNEICMQVANSGCSLAIIKKRDYAFERLDRFVERFV